MRLRSRVLDAEPLCVLCRGEGLVVEAREVDHILPLHRGGTDDWANLRGLCIPCHRRVSRAQAAERASRIVGCDAEGRPLAWRPPGRAK